MKEEQTIQLSFFNTIHLSGEELKEARESCSKQEERVLQLFQRYGAMTPFDVEYFYKNFWNHIPITSIRRAMTVLTDKGKLEKLNEMKEGNYGKPNHKWRLKT